MKVITDHTNREEVSVAMHPCATGTVAAHATRILVVEDDADIRSVLCEILRDHGFDVAAACNGRDALDQLRRGARPSLILLDLMMPIMSGADFRAAQLATPELRGIPV